MSREMDLLRRLAEGDNRGDFFISLELLKEVEAILTLPEPIKEREVSGKIISTDDVCNWNLTVGALKDYDHVYVNGIRYTEFQPDINTQYLLDQVARLTTENAMLKEKWLSQPEQEPVAWIIETEIEGKLSEWICTDKKHYMNEHDATKDPIPLYTAPPKREPLSDERLEFLVDKYHGYPKTLGRAIEKAHGIGGGE